MSTVYFDDFAAETLPNSRDQKLPRFRLSVIQPNSGAADVNVSEQAVDPESINRANRREDQFAHSYAVALLILAALCLLPLAVWALNFAVTTISMWQPGEALNSIVGNSLF